MELMQRRRELMTFEHGYWATATGSIATFNTPFAKLLRSLKAEFTPVQEGSGDPSPSNVRPITGWTRLTAYRTGKNLFDSSHMEQFKVNSDSLLYGHIFTKAATYSIHAYGTGESSYLYARVKNTDGTLGNVIYIVGDLVKTDNTIVTLSEGQTLFVYNAQNQTEEYAIQKFTAWQVQVAVASVQPETYESYSGTTIPVTFPAVGKNLLDVSDLQTGVWWNGSILTSYTANKATRKLPIKPNTTYYLKRTSGSQNYCSFFDEDGVFLRQVPLSSNGQRFTTESDEYFIGITLSATDYSTAQLELGSSATAYEPFTNTVYGGYVDLVKGELVETWHSVDMGRLDYTYRSNLGGGAFSGTMNEAHGAPKPQNLWVGICSKYPYLGSYNALVGKSQGIGYVYSKDVIVKDTSVTLDDPAVMKASLSGTILCYPLATPIVHQLTPQQISALVGTNNIWSTANGNVTAEYWTR